MAAVRATRKHCLRMKVSVAGAASGIMGVAAGGGGAIGIGGHRDGEFSVEEFTVSNFVFGSKQDGSVRSDGMATIWHG